MRKVVSIVFSLLSLAACSGRQLAPGDTTIEAAIARTREIRIAPGAHVIYLLDDEITEVDESGDARRTVTQVCLATTPRGRDLLVRNSVPPDARILRAYSLGPGGRRWEATSRRIGEIRFDELGVSSIVVLQYVYVMRSPAYLHNHFASSWWFQGVDRQVVEARWTVSLARGRELVFRTEGPVSHVHGRRGGREVHRFSARDVPPLVPEPSMPPQRNLLAAAHASTLTQWDDFVEWERALFVDLLDVSPEVRAIAARETSEAATPRARLERLFLFVAEQIQLRTVDEAPITGVRPEAGRDVLTAGSGSSKDQALLLFLLAREVGIRLEFAYLLTAEHGDLYRDIPSQQFNHVIIHVPAQDGLEEAFFLDPTATALDVGNLPVNAQGTLALVMDLESDAFRFVEVPFQPPELQSLRCESHVEIVSAEEVSATVTCLFRGAAAAMLRVALRDDERSRGVLQRLGTTLFAGSVVRESSARNVHETSQELEIEMTLSLAEAVRPEGSSFRLPFPSFGFTVAGVTTLEIRRTPLRVGAPERLRHVVRYSIPEQARFVSLPETIDVNHRCMRTTRVVEQAERDATVHFESTKTCHEVSTADYPSFRRAVQQVADALRTGIVFEL